jgi:hypothetical protein
MSKEQQKRLQGIARYLTNGDLQSMAKQYLRGECPNSERGHKLHRGEFEFICTYMKTSPQKVLAV